MTETLSTPHPHPATVIALGVNTADQAARARFTELLGGTLAHTCTLQPASHRDNELSYTAIVPDSTQTLSLLRRLLSIQQEFHQQYPAGAFRFLVHHGLVFLADGQFVGAILRSAQSRLSRLPAGIRQAATSEFADYVATWSVHPVTFSKLPSASEQPGLLDFSLHLSPDAEPADGSAQAEAFLRHLTKCLATHLGPFAEVIVDAARRSSASPQQMIEELASEIADATAREKFRSDAREFGLQTLG